MPAQRTRKSTTRYRDRLCNDPNYDTRIQDTLGKIASDDYGSFREAERITGIPAMTLNDRAKGRHDSWRNACAKRQLLTPEQEDTLVKWCELRASMGEPWSHEELRAQAEEISGKPVGRHWHRKFEKRHPEICAAKPARLDPKRAKHFNESIINDFFDQWEALNAKYAPDGIPPEHVFDWDEKGIQMGGGRKKSSRKFYFLKDQRQRYRIQSDNLELVTILECISAAGDVVPPSFCLQNGAKPDLRELSDGEWGSIYFSETGWTDSFNAERWLDEVFIPFAKSRRVDPTKPIVLFMDGHETHETPEMQRTVYKHLDGEDLEIILFCLPSKTTHKLQPLDVLVFSQVERKWQAVCDEAVKNKTPINRFTVIPSYIRGTRSAMTKELIQKSWEKTGIYPINRNVFGPEDFAPSQSSSSVACVPSSFPADVPSSDPIEPSDVDSEGEDFVTSDSDYESDGSQSTSSNISLDLATDTESQIGDDISLLQDEVEGESQETSDGGSSQDRPLSGLMAALTNIEDNVIHMTRSATARLDLFCVAPPKIVSLEEDRKLSSEERLTEIRSLRQQLMGAYQALGRALAQLNASNAHCTTIRRQLDHVQQQLQSVSKKKERGSKKIRARFLTSKDLRAEFDREDAERLERERIAAEKLKQKEAENAETARRVADDAANRNFTGRMSSYRKDDLRALALALGISDQGDKKELHARIGEKFQQNPGLKTNARFSGLFTKSRSRRRLNQIAVADPIDSDSDDAGALESDPEIDPELLSTPRAHELRLVRPLTPTQHPAPLLLHHSYDYPGSASHPAPSSAYFSQYPYPYYNQPGYLPYFTPRQPPSVQNGHEQQHYQSKFYNPSNSAASE